MSQAGKLPDVIIGSLVWHIQPWIGLDQIRQAYCNFHRYSRLVGPADFVQRGTVGPLYLLRRTIGDDIGALRVHVAQCPVMHQVSQE